MATNHYFNHFSPATINEQRLLEDMIVESIQIMGHDCWYIPRDAYNSIDQILGESVNAKFTRAYAIESYIANVEGYEGDGDFFSKFGLEIRDTSNFIISYRSFQRYIPSVIATHPREGDLIFVPLMRKLFEIKFVEEELLFFSLGKRHPYMYELRCEVFRYSNENIETGVEEVDDVEKDNAYSMLLDVAAGNGSIFYDGEVVYQGANLEYATAQATVKDFNVGDSLLNIYKVKGVFEQNTTIIGATSNAHYTVVEADPLNNDTIYDFSDNKPLETDADAILDLSEINPLGNP
jgi:hypothetical protein